MAEEKNAENWKKFEILLANFQNIGEAQSKLVNGLSAFLALVWSIDFLQSTGGIELHVLGATIKVSGLWPIVPLINTIFILAIIGTINLTVHAWRRLDLFLPEVFSDPGDFFFSELDNSKNILDLFTSLSASFTKPILPDSPKAENVNKQKFDPRLFAYPVLIIIAVFTSSFALRRITINYATSAYVIVLTIVPVVFALPFIWRKTCQFFGIHNNGYDGIAWGTDALYRLPFSSLEGMVKASKERRNS